MDIGSMRWAAMAALVMGVSGASAQPFTYQGSLSDGGQPADGEYDVRVTLLNEGGGTVAGPLTFNDIQVSEGVFNVELDFGVGSFDGNARLLGLEFRAGASAGGFTELLPNTPINPTPYALYAFDAFSEVTRQGQVLRIGEGTGSDVAIVNPAMTNGARVNSFTEFQVNFDGPNNFGGMYINGRQPDDIPFVGFAIGEVSRAFIDYSPVDDQIRFWDGDGFEPIVRMGTPGVSIAPELFVGGDLVVAFNSDIRGSLGVLSVGGTLSASSEIRSGADTVVGDDLEVEDQIVKDYGIDEFRSAIPIAYGTFSSSGSFLGGTPNVSAVWDAGLLRYVVSISGFNASSEPEVVHVTPKGSTPRFATASTVSGNVLVYIHDLNGNRVQAPFDIVVYDGGTVFTIQSDD
ncbi:MAG: hypothetical protein AB8F26_01095 [Phycisphaerales bacterium]